MVWIKKPHYSFGVVSISILKYIVESRSLTLAKEKIIYVCSNDECDYQKSISFGLCPKCKNGFGTAQKLEKNIIKKSIKPSTIGSVATSNKEYIKNKEKSTLQELKKMKNISGKRIDTGFHELNLLFGGSEKNIGITKDSLTLISGAPGIGKSTLLAQIIDYISIHEGLKCAYISAEENKEQIKNRALRLNLKSDIVIENESNLLQILVDFEDYDFLIIDSIQTMYIEENGEIGGVSQVKKCTMALLNYAKISNKTIIIVGQVNKDDTISGPKMLEHMVDTVIYFDNYDEQGLYRYTKSIKNRFGQVGEISIFEMKENGLKEISNPSLLFINKDQDNEHKIGSTISIVIDGKKPLFVETQALLVDTNAEKTITQSIGFDNKRIFQILAIISKYLGESVYSKNVFLATTGGIKIKDTHTDLSIAASILSSVKNKILNKYIFIGELGLSGEIFLAPNEKELIKQAKKFGFNKIICKTEGYNHIKDLIPLYKN